MTHPTVEKILADTHRAYPGIPDKISMAAIERCHVSLLDHYRSGTRVKVKDTLTGYERTGTVTRTAGWQPALMLLHRSNSYVSSDLLNADDRVVAIWNGRRYVDV